MPESQSEAVALAIRAATQWMEAVTGHRFPADRTFRASLQNGAVLCELMETLSPGLIRRNSQLDNLQQFLLGCKDLGLSKEQLFDQTDLQEASYSDQSREKRKSLNEKLKNVCMTLFWLSQVVDYSGPQLDLSPFTSLFPEQQASGGQEDSLTSEEEQTADQLLADIQSAVDDMLQDFHANTLSPDSAPGPPPSQPPLHTSFIDESSLQAEVECDREEVMVEMSSSGGGFGFQVRGGLDTMLRAQVDMVLPGSVAEKGGVRSGDEIIRVNGRDVTALKHADLVAAIRQAGSEGCISLSLLRVVEERPSKPLPPEEAQLRQAAALKRMYPRSHQFLDSQLGTTLTPVLEEELDLSPPLPPLPGELNEPLPPLPGEDTAPLTGGPQATPYIYISPQPPLPGEQVTSDLPLDMAAVVSVRDSVREMEQLQQLIELTSQSPPQLSPPALRDVVEEEGMELMSEELEAIVQDLGQASQPSERGEGEGEEQREEESEEEEVAKISDQPWEPKAQWEDNNVRVGEGELVGEGRKGKIWSFLEEKTRVSNEERAQASSKPTPPPPPVRKLPPPKVLPKPVRKKSREQPATVGREAEEEVFIPSRDPNMITIQSTSSAEPLNVRPVMAEEVELRGDIKIQKVAQTRWTPQKKSPKQIQRSTSIPLQSPPTETPPVQPAQQEGRYGGAPPTGPVKQVSAPQFPLRGLQQKGSRGQRLAEQTRLSGPPRGAPVGGPPTKIRVQSVSAAQANGGPSYDSLSNVAREIHQQQQQAKLRSRTWGARERSQFTGQPVHPARPALAMPDLQRQDGPQQAFLVKPANPNLPCSLCNRPLGPQPPLIAIPGLHLHFHPHCFACPVCHTFLAPPRGHTSTTVMVRSMRPHCHYCTSNTQGVRATEC